MTERTGDGPQAARRWGVGMLVLAAAGVGFAASSAGGGWESWLGDRPGRLAPYTLVKPAAVSLDREAALLQARIRANPDGFLDLVALAEVYMRRGKASGEASWYLLAEQAARRSLASFSGDNPGAHMVLARVAIARHDFAQARAIATAVGKTHPHDPGVRSALATIDLAQGDLAAAAAAAEALVTSAPGLEAYAQRGLVRAAQGREADAIADFARAIALEQPGQLDGSAMARAWLGRLHARHGRLDAAEDLYREALRIVPTQPVALALTAELEARRGRFDEAARRYADAYARDPSPAYLLGAARVAAERGRAAEADAIWQRAERQLRRDLAAGSFGHRRDLATLLLERGRPAEAAEAQTLMAAELRVRRDAETWHGNAWALMRLGRHPEAAAAMARALAFGAPEAAWLHRAGEIQAALGQPARATAYFQAATAQDPTFRPPTWRAATRSER